MSPDLFCPPCVKRKKCLLSGSCHRRPERKLAQFHESAHVPRKTHCNKLSVKLSVPCFGTPCSHTAPRDVQFLAQPPAAREAELHSPKACVVDAAWAAKWSSSSCSSLHWLAAATGVLIGHGSNIFNDDCSSHSTIYIVGPAQTRCHMLQVPCEWHLVSGVNVLFACWTSRLLVRVPSKAASHNPSHEGATEDRFPNVWLSLFFLTSWMFKRGADFNVKHFRNGKLHVQSAPYLAHVSFASDERRTLWSKTFQRGTGPCSENEANKWNFSAPFTPTHPNETGANQETLGRLSVFSFFTIPQVRIWVSQVTSWRISLCQLTVFLERLASQGFKGLLCQLLRARLRLVL